MFLSAYLIVSLVGSLSLTAAKTLRVDVGLNGTLTFSPETLDADIGDQISFHFSPANHSVTQSTCNNPCTFKDGGFDSGFMPVTADIPDPDRPTFNITVTDSNPIWVYCRQASGTPKSHCGAGMVFAVNGDASFTAFKDAAVAVGKSLQASASATVDATSASADASSTDIPSAADAAADVTPTASGTSSSSIPDYSPPTSSASPPSQTHTVVVGGDQKVFTPSTISAEPGDTIVFEFHQVNHTVTQSSFADPCTRNVSGFDSGFMPAASSGPFPMWNVTVNDTAPVWVYCRQMGHCNLGMVFALNSVETSPNNFSAFQAAAMAATSTGSASSIPSSTVSSSDSPTSARSNSASSTSTGSTSPNSAHMPVMRIHALAFSTVIAYVVGAFF